MATQIYCSKPTVILNPSAADLLPQYKTYHTPAGDQTISNTVADYWRYRFPKHLFSAKVRGVTVDNIDDYYIIDKHTGTMYPMYIQVPCGHCELCRDKKAREWSFRATCENATSTARPLFITLTYNNAHLPKKGVFKEEVQLFMKRLRIRLDRLEVKHNIRYFACGEYGHLSKRPHYHLILWNFPDHYVWFRNKTNILHFVEKCWTFGWCYCLPCDKGAIGYVMKYMRKELDVSEGCNPVFFLSSRKNGGIGAAYAKKYIQYYRDNPQQLDMSVTDPYSGQTVTAKLPAYFRRLYYPSLSQCVDKTIRDAHRELLDKIALRNSLNAAMPDNYRQKLDDVEVQVLKKYWFLRPNITVSPIPKQVEFFRTLDFGAWSARYETNEFEIASLCRYLLLETYDEQYLKVMQKLKSARECELTWAFANRVPLDVNEIKYNLIQRMKLAFLKEKI